MNDNIKYFFPKVGVKISNKKNQLLKYLPVERISLFSIGRLPDRDKLADILSDMLSIDSVRSIINLDMDEKAAILSSAEKSLNHQFRYLGVEINFQDEISWNIDFYNRFEWPVNLFYQKQRGKGQKGADIKFPWELSRCHQLLWLGEAYLLTRDEKYAKEVVYELEDWIIKNPLMYTVNWTCAMEVAIRAVNWMYALLFIKDSTFFTDQFANKVYKSLYQHAYFIINNLEKTIPYCNNHYYSDIVGLLYLGQLFHHTRRGKRWFKFAVKEYYQETLCQNLPSGVNYEKSVSYHRLMTELALYPYYMLERVGLKVPEVVRQRLIHMVQYVKLNAMPNGKAPMIADNDDGRFLPFVPRDFREHLYLTDENSLDFKIITSGTKTISCLPICLESRLMQDSKIAILRRGDCYLFVTNADRWRFDMPNGKYVGSHMHSDLLSFVYTIGKSEIFVDSGSYVYTSDLDKHLEFRSTAKHNTIVVDGEEQHLRDIPSAFMMKYNSTSKPLTLTQMNECDECSGEYTTHKGNMTHNRTFILGRRKLQISDKITKIGSNHQVEMSFHLAPGIIPSVIGKVVHFEVDNSKFTMKFECDGEFKITIKEDTVSPSYGVLQNSKTIVIEQKFNENTEFHTIIKNEKNQDYTEETLFSRKRTQI